MKTFRFSLSFLLIFALHSYSQQTEQNTGSLKSSQATLLPKHNLNDSITFTSQTKGPFLIGNDEPVRVYVTIIRVHFPESMAHNMPESDVSYEISDSLGTIFLRRNFPATGECEMSFDFTQEDIPTIGKVLNCTREVLPSAPQSGVDSQLLGLDDLGQIVSLTGVISSETFKIVYLNPSQGTTPTDPFKAFSEPFVEGEFWTGNFTAVNYYYINPTGVPYDAAETLPYGFEKTPVRIDPDQAQNDRALNKDQAPTIFLFTKPDRNSKDFKKVLVKVKSSIQFLDAVYGSGWWLHIIIDDQEGYVQPDELNKLGLPDAG